jgi:hypothetical protein
MSLTGNWQQVQEKPPPFFRGVATAGSNGHFMLLAAAGGSLNGVFNTWSGSFDQARLRVYPSSSTLSVM